MLPADNHIHTQFSWDTRSRSSMVTACERAIAAGIPAVAFTEHVDFIEWGALDVPMNDVPEARAKGGIQPLDVEGYVASIDECRQRYPDLRILSGVEAGEPHLFAGSIANLLGRASFDRVLGSLHSLPRGGLLVGVGWFLSGETLYDVVRDYCAELLRMVESSAVFEVLAHFDYPRRYWPNSAAAYQDAKVEEEHRAVFRALATSGRVLEINTASPLASAAMMRWWYEEGGGAVSFGSDAHTPQRVGDRFDVAVDVVEAAGFRPGRDRFDFWRR
ncbi:PHP domain-containing protein [soil metagenome]